MKQDSIVRRLIQGFSNYLTFFVISAALVTCTTMLFVSTMANSMQIELTDKNISVAAKLTFANVLFLSGVFTIIDAVRRKLTVERAAKHIVEATRKIVDGDFTARIDSFSHFGVDENFNNIIESFNKMAEELSGVETLRTDFIANVSHEMKTPLAVLQNYGTLLQDPFLSEEKRKEYAKGVADGSRRLADMMTNILKLNRLENQQIYPNTTEFDLGEQICECLLQYENVWEKSKIEIDTHIGENVKVKADAELLSHVWNNLFSNAFKFTQAGGMVKVTLTTTEHHAIVKVKDTGCGMSPEIGAHIFEKFYQGDTSHATQGNGLGLTLVKRVIDIMHAEISVESTLGKGTTFTVKIRRV
ncbi:MAG: HAMP domain-containing histidine kinase [Lachnospiraceae bacterium]|nr:HAMP domain-containing histidine kinase [Lachnospiraceae bacterium]